MPIAGPQQWKSTPALVKNQSQCLSIILSTSSTYTTQLAQWSQYLVYAYFNTHVYDTSKI